MSDTTPTQDTGGPGFPAPELADFSVRELAEALPGWEYGTGSPDVLARLAAAALDKAGQDARFAPLARSIAAWGWQSAPLHHGLAGLCLATARAVNQGDAPDATLAKDLALRLTPPDEEDWDEALNLESDDTLLEFIKSQLARPRRGPGWLAKGVQLLRARSALKSVDHLLAAAQAAGTVPVAIADRYRAENALHRRAPDEALPLVLDLDDKLFGLWKQYARGRLAALGNAPEAAAHAYAGLWQVLPWHVNLALTLNELRNPLQTDRDAVRDAASRTCVCVYTWNKAAPLRATLDSLRSSALHGARVVVLDNGSTDDTAQVIEAAAKHWADDGIGPFEHVALPVNIGAPPARNWLLSLPAAQEAEYVAFLDDDVLLPRDWLERLAATLLAHPEAGVAGCAVRDHTLPHALQCTDFHLIPDSLGGRSFADIRENIFVYDNAGHVPDNGLFEYTRPCVSVTGCCHLLRRAAIDKAGPFDVRFNPSQFDDLERDLRSYLAGMPAIYHGGCKVGHMQHSSLRQAADPAATAHVMGNKLKLEHLYTERQVEEIRAADREAVLADLEAATRALRQG